MKGCGTLGGYASFLSLKSSLAANFSVYWRREGRGGEERGGEECIVSLTSRDKKAHTPIPEPCLQESASS